MKTSTISGDIVAFTSLSLKNKQILEKGISNLIQVIQKEFNSFCRIVKGDYLECVIDKPAQTLRIATLIKCYIKSVELESETDNKRFKYFKNYGIRLAIGYGDLKRFDSKKGIIDGEAIYMSGRKISEENTHHKERIVIKNTLFFISKEAHLNQQFEGTIALLDFILNKATAKQCEVLYYKLLGHSEKEISKIMEISQPVVNQHSISAGWNAIETAVKNFNSIIKNS